MTEVHPLLGDLADVPQAEHLETTGVGQDGPRQFMKSCRSPWARITSCPGRSQRWKVLPSRIWARSRAPSSGVIP